MESTKSDRPKYPPVDKLKAVILERKLVMHLSTQDLGDAANVSGWYIRKLISSKHTNEWPADVRDAICQRLGISIKVTLQDLFDLSKEMNCE